jgi:hypothetical protein
MINFVLFQISNLLILLIYKAQKTKSVAGMMQIAYGSRKFAYSAASCLGDPGYMKRANKTPLPHVLSCIYVYNKYSLF